MDGAWEDIPPADGPEADNVRRADPSHPLDLFRGRDFAGRYLLTLTAKVAGSVLPEPPRLAGIDVILEGAATARMRLVIRLQETGQADIFRALCEHLIAATRALRPGDNEQGMRLILRRLRHWHDLLKRRRNDVLSPPERIGLAGELLFLRDRVLRALPAHQAVLSWRGAHKEEQDFALGRWQIEVKTQLSTADQRLQISSEAQLEAAADVLLLCHQCLAAAPIQAAGAITLNRLVDEIRMLIGEAGDSTHDAFDEALDAWRYAPRPEYGEDWWLLTGRELYEVGAGFPRITPAMLPAGVRHVRYEIGLHECQPYRVDLETTLGEVFT